MLKSYFKSTFRNMMRRKLLSGTMIAGLALGILSSFLLLTYVIDQFSYDRYLPDSNRTYRITSDYHGMENNFARDAAEKSNHKEHDDFSRRTRRSLFIYHSFFVLFAPFLRDLCG